MQLRCDFDLTSRDLENPNLTDRRIKQRVAEAFAEHLMDIVDIRKTPIEKSFLGEVTRVESAFHYLTEDQFHSIMYKLDMIDRLGRFIGQPDFINIARQIKGVFNGDNETPRFNIDFDAISEEQMKALRTNMSPDRWRKEYLNSPDQPVKPSE